MAEAGRQIKVAIAGGGIAGLALAAGLHEKHKNIDFHVYEATAAYKDIGAGLAIHLNGIKAMELVNPALRQAYSDKGSLMGEEDQEMSTQVILAHGKYSGELIAELGKAKGRKTVSRADLLEGFSELIPKDRISFGKRLEKIEQDEESVKLTFQDGSTTRADCLIGADGVHSPTRRYVLGANDPAVEPVNHEHWHIYRRTVPMEVARQHVSERWTRGIPILLGPRAYLNSMPLSKGTRLSASVCVRGVEIGQDGAIPKLDSKHFEEYDEDARNIVELVTHDWASWIPTDHDHASICFRGNVAIIGDAAHATMAFNGQGAAQALEDVAVLDHLFSRLTSVSQLQALFSAFDTIRRPRSQRVVDLSRQFGRIYTYAEGDLHDDPAEMRRVFGAGGSYTNNVDLAKQNDDAMNAFENFAKSSFDGAVSDG